MSNDENTVPTPGDPTLPTPTGEQNAVEEPKRKSFGATVSSIIKRALLALIGVAVLIVLYFVLRSVVPRQWADFVRDFTGGHGLTWGVVFGVVFTLVPIVCLAMAVASWDKLKHTIGVVFLLVGIVFAIPNLLTLAVNTSNPTTPGPAWEAKNTLNGIIGFQGATLVGAIIGGVIGLVIVYYIVKYKMRGRKIRAAQAAAHSDAPVEK
ncbi:hypothetical protein HUN08_09205 [Gordonia sp. X0973]|uniref:hypothetical protein n=1 Tax=Gordonia sp. X0973 TaxID=2742602 RepID=UPI000F52815B|nr:hypothetical protein [Gordonia sp. X0973]QKT07347.1 hypothetical protein HUN08_09205 [Gordonia sp. X0973]